MKVKIRVFGLLSCVTAMSIFSVCSNSLSPVSEVTNPDPVKSAQIIDIPISDISVGGFSGTGQIWALSINKVPNLNDWYIYKFDGTTGNWISTGHYGTMISATYVGKCYHVNSSNQIWWGTLTSNSQIPNGSDIVRFTDISATHIAGALFLYVTGTNSSGQKRLWRYTSNPSGNSWNRLIPRSEGTLFPDNVHSDPKDGNKVIVVTSGFVQISTDAGNTWAWQTDYLLSSNAAWSDGNIIWRSDDAKIWVKKAGTAAPKLIAQSSLPNVSTWGPYYYYISNNYLQYGNY
jgi:hypothetical protein